VDIIHNISYKTNSWLRSS